MEAIHYSLPDIYNQALLLECNKEKFTSKIIYESGKTKAILFAFAAGQALKTHTAPVDVLLIPVLGEALFTVELVSYLITAGEIIKIPAHAEHSVQAKTDFKMLLIK